MNDRLNRRISAKQSELDKLGLLRSRSVFPVSSQLKATEDHASCINFASNDYLGLATEAELIESLYHGAKAYGVGSGASPLVTGYQSAHLLLEQKLCQLTGMEAGLLFCSGFSANHALITTLFNQDDCLVADKLIHASVIDGIMASKAKLKRFVHNNVESAANLIKRHAPQAILTESVFSMDGDVAPLKALAKLAHDNDAWFIVDDAHGFGVIGEHGLGARELSQDIDILLVTFGKALGCQGAAILGSRALIDYLVANARHYIYSTALSPALAHVALSSLGLIDTQTKYREQLGRNIAQFKQLCAQQSIALLPSETPIQPVLIGDDKACVDIAQNLLERGVKVAAIRPPTVPKGGARLRITLSAKHSQEEIALLVTLLGEQLNGNPVS